jgi:hypothetical protein
VSYRTELSYSMADLADVDGAERGLSHALAGGELSHADFAAEVLAASAAPRRIASVVADIVGDRVAIGEHRVGPSGVGVASAIGVPGPIEATASNTPGWDVDVTVPVQLRVRVQVAGGTARYEIAVRVQTRIKLVPVQPCSVFVKIAEIREEHIDAEVNPRGLPSRLVGWVGRINSVVAAEVVDYINTLFGSPEVMAVRHIDVAQMIDRAWDAGFVIQSPIPRAGGGAAMT